MGEKTWPGKWGKKIKKTTKPKPKWLGIKAQRGDKQLDDGREDSEQRS